MTEKPDDGRKATFIGGVASEDGNTCHCSVVS